MYADLSPGVWFWVTYFLRIKVVNFLRFSVEGSDNAAPIKVWNQVPDTPIPMKNNSKVNKNSFLLAYSGKAADMQITASCLENWVNICSSEAYHKTQNAL